MIDGLDNVLESYGQPGLTELRRLLEELLGGREAEGRVLDQQALQPRSRCAVILLRCRAAPHTKSAQSLSAKQRPFIRC